jgi:hypothetical protein
MATCVADERSKMTAPQTDHHVRVMRWTFRRSDETVVCELGLSRDHTAYELRVDPPWNPAGITSELFDDATSAFERHAGVERILVNDGWSLESFEPGGVARD